MKKISTYVLLTISVISFSGCSGTFDLFSNSIPNLQKYSTPEGVYADTISEFSLHENSFKLVSPTIRPEGIYHKGNTFFLRQSWLNANKKPTVLDAQLYVVVGNDRWLFLDSAYSEGEALNVTKITRNLNDLVHGSIKEHIAINLSESEIRRIAKLPEWSFKLTGKAGGRIINVPGSLFAGFLKAVDDCAPDGKRNLNIPCPSPQAKN